MVTDKDREELLQYLRHEATWSMAQDGTQVMWFTEKGLRDALESQPPAEPEPVGKSLDELLSTLNDAVGDLMVDGYSGYSSAIAQAIKILSAKPEPQDEDCEPCDLMRGPPCPDCKRYTPKPEPMGDALHRDLDNYNDLTTVREYIESHPMKSILDKHGRKLALESWERISQLLASQGQGDAPRIAELEKLIEDRGKLWAHEEDSYALDASRLAEENISLKALLASQGQGEDWHEASILIAEELKRVYPEIAEASDLKYVIRRAIAKAYPQPTPRPETGGDARENRVIIHDALKLAYELAQDQGRPAMCSHLQMAMEALALLASQSSAIKRSLTTETGGDARDRLKHVLNETSATDAQFLEIMGLYDAALLASQGQGARSCLNCDNWDASLGTCAKNNVEAGPGTSHFGCSAETLRDWTPKAHPQSASGLREAKELAYEMERCRGICINYKLEGGDASLLLESINRSLDRALGQYRAALAQSEKEGK